MKIRTIIIPIAALLCLCGFLQACNPQMNPAPTPTPSAEVAAKEAAEPSPTPSTVPTPTPDPDGIITLENFPILDGSTATIPLAMALIREYTGCTEAEAEAKADFSTTDDSYIEMVYEESDLLLVYEASEKTKERYDIESKLDFYPIGQDALVFLVNADNPVDSLTTQQIQDIYSGKTTNWKEVGGKDMPIVAFQRQLLSGSQTMMRKLVMGDIPMATAPAEYIAGEMSGLVEQVAAYDNTANAIGYSVYYYAKNMYALPGLKFIAVNKVEPSESNIATQQYPFINQFYGVLPKDNPHPYAMRILDWLLTDEGQTFVASCGYVPARPIAETSQLQKPEAGDKDLWDKDYYAVLPSEGGNMRVYDNRGQSIGSFAVRGLGLHDGLPYGMYTAQELAEQVLFANGKQKIPAPETIQFPTNSYAGGFLRYDWAGGMLYVYDKDFTLRYTVPAEQGIEESAYYYDETAAILPLGENELIFFYHKGVCLIRPQIRTKDGKLVSYPKLKDADGKDVQIIGVFAEKYLIGVSKDGKYSFYDTTESLVVKDVVPIVQEFLGFVGDRTTKSWVELAFSARCFVKNGWLYGADLRAASPAKLLPANLDFGYNYWETDGFIQGMICDIDGVASSGAVKESEGGAFIQGYANGYLHVKRGERTYRFAVDGKNVDLWDLNDKFALFYRGGENNTWGEYEVQILKTGERILGNRYYIRLKGEYCIFQKKYWDNSTDEPNEYALDENGDKVLHFNMTQLLPGGMILLRRGPYIGIADVDGNWLVKTLWAYLANDSYLD